MHLGSTSFKGASNSGMSVLAVGRLTVNLLLAKLREYWGAGVTPKKSDGRAPLLCKKRSGHCALRPPFGVSLTLLIASYRNSAVWPVLSTWMNRSRLSDFVVSNRQFIRNLTCQQICFKLLIRDWEGARVRRLNGWISPRSQQRSESQI